jgi:outer membrane protease
MKLTITIQLDNATLTDNGREAETSSIIQNFITDRLDSGTLELNAKTRVYLSDSNGNKVGTVIVTE